MTFCECPAYRAKPLFPADGDTICRQCNRPIQQAFIDRLAVGDRVSHSDPAAAGILGTVESFDDTGEMGDVLVKWDSPLPWVAVPIGTVIRIGMHAWHSPGFLHPPLPPQTG